MPSDNTTENDYFRRLEAKKKEKLKARITENLTAAQREERKKLHWLRCGKCGAEMETHAFRNVEIEICPECGAVLLDHGELEQLAGQDSTGLIQGLLSIFSRK